MSHVPASAAWPEEAFRAANLLKFSEVNPYTGVGLIGDDVAIYGELIPAPKFHIVWRRNGKIRQERILSVAETSRALDSIVGGRFALWGSTGHCGPYGPELVPVEFCPIYRKMEPNWAWRGKWEVA